MSEADDEQMSARVTSIPRILSALFSGFGSLLFFQPRISLFACNLGSLSRAALCRHIFARSSDLERWGRSPRTASAPTDFNIGTLRQDLQALLFRRSAHHVVFL
jgi:hypothetical protein